MIAYKRKYLASIGAGEQDYVPCELCGTPAADIHHVVLRSAGGSDEPSNLVSLCRSHHDDAHRNDGSLTEEMLLKIVRERIDRNSRRGLAF